MKLWKWQQGRQKSTEYKKFPLWYFRIGKWGFDAYILKYEPNTVLDWHTDPVKGGKHWRLNIKLWGNSNFKIAKATGIDITNQTINLFRADCYSHSLVVFTKTYKLSLGFVKFE